jgi:hypothetical protein
VVRKVKWVLQVSLEFLVRKVCPVQQVLQVQVDLVLRVQPEQLVRKEFKVPSDLRK